MQQALENKYIFGFDHNNKVYVYNKLRYMYDASHTKLFE